MTVPVVLAIGFFSGRTLELGLEPTDIAMLTLTLLTSVITLGTGKNNTFTGCCSPDSIRCLRHADF